MGDEQKTKMTIPGDSVTQALKRLVDAGEIDEAGRSEIWWFYSYCRETDTSLDEAGRAINKDASTVFRLFSGKYGASYDGLVEAVKKFHALHNERGGRKKIGFVETSIWGKIETVSRHALVSQIPVFIFGDSQIGKTTCLKEFARRNNHGTTKYLELPTAATLSTVKREVAKACYIGAKISEHELNERIPKAITGNMLIIVDEFHRPFKTSNRYQAVRIAEWLRELYDKTKCGMVFSATNIGLEELETGPSSLVLEQFRRRGMMQLILPPTPPRADVNKFAKAFGLPPPDGEALEVIGAILKRSGLNQYVLFLQSAANLAANQNKPVSWDHFLVAHDKIQSLSKG